MNSKPIISIIDYGMGNLGSIYNALHYLECNVIVTNQAEDIKKSHFIILPGVGAFGSAMQNLRKNGLDLSLTEQVLERKKPFLGICLGMQLLMHSSEENESETGLSWVNGIVKKLPDTNQRVPHMGWNTLRYKDNVSLYKSLPNNVDVYFVHSYYVETDDKNISAYSDYGMAFAASIEKENIQAVQFHPEKSHHAGLAILKNFIAFADAY